MKSPRESAARHDDLDAEREVDLRSVWERDRRALVAAGARARRSAPSSASRSPSAAARSTRRRRSSRWASRSRRTAARPCRASSRTRAPSPRSSAPSRRCGGPRTPPACRVRALRGNVSSAIVGASGPGAGPTGAPLVTIKVVAAQPRKAETAADALAKEVIDAHVGEVRRHQDQDASTTSSLDPGPAEHARSRGSARCEQAVNEPGLARSTSSCSCQLARQRAGRGGASCSTSRRRPAAARAGGERREGAGHRAGRRGQDDRAQRPQRRPDRRPDRAAARLSRRRSSPIRSSRAAPAPPNAMVDGKRVAVVVPAHDEERADRGRRSPGSPSSSTGSRRRRRLDRRDGRQRALVGDRRVELVAHEQQRRRRRRDRHRLPSARSRTGSTSSA